MDGSIKDIDFGPYDFGSKRTLADYEHYAGISFKRRKASKYTLEHKVPPNPNFNDDTECELMSEIMFEHCIELHQNQFDKTEDYDFWAIIYEDDAGTSLHRLDLAKNDIQSHLSASNDMICIHNKFCTTSEPRKWIVWPHSATNGWLTKIEKNVVKL